MQVQSKTSREVRFPEQLRLRRTGVCSMSALAWRCSSLPCIVPFLFVIIISFTSEDSIRQIGSSLRAAELGHTGV